MDPCCLDKNMDDKEFSFLGNDFFTPPLSTDRSSEMDFRLDDGMDHDWFDSLFNDPVLNDCMISDALQPNPRVQSEHSYSLANNDSAIDMTVKKDTDKDCDSELLTVNPNSMILTSSSQVKTDSKFSTCDNNQTVESPSVSVLPTVSIPSSEFNVSTMAECGLSSSTTLNSENGSSIAGFVKKEPLDAETAMVTVTRTMNPQTLLKPTIILATQQSNFQHHAGTSILTRTQDRLVLPKVNVKVEPSYSVSSSMLGTSVTVKQETTDHNSYDQLSLPPTPPSSSTSDSEGCHSPERSAPSSPVRGATHYQSALIQHHSSRYSPSPPPSTSFFMNPIPTSGVLILSEEEKRTLISEGYPIPSKLPLTKGEEKNLKKIRRKIKNKISAQESRRKKKEYLESLEKKVESYSQENMDLKKKMDSLENNNRSLMSQLQKLQSLISKIRPQSSSQTGTCLMVLVLCFAVFLGTCSPMTWSIGYSSIVSTPSSIVNDKPISNMMLSENQHQNYNQPFSVAAPDGIVEVQTIFEVPKNSDDSSVAGSINTEGEQRWSINRQDGTPVIGPEVKDATVNPYSTKLKSRVLLSIKEESQTESTEAAYGWPKSFCLQDYLTTWFSSCTSSGAESPQQAENTDRHLLTDPSLPKVHILDVETENNQTGEGSNFGKPAVIHPDVTVMTQVDTTA